MLSPARSAWGTKGVEFKLLHLYQTRQAFSATIGCPALHPKACWKAAEFCTAPFTRHRPGECGSVSTRFRASWSVTFWHQICPYARKYRCVAPYPSMGATGAVPMMFFSAIKASFRPPLSAVFSPSVNLPLSLTSPLSSFTETKPEYSLAVQSTRCSNSLASSAVHQSRRFPSASYFAPPVIEAVREFMSDHHADGAIVHGVIHQLAVKRRLQNARREVDIVHRSPVIRVDRRRSHPPILAVRRPVDLLVIALHLERSGAHRIAGIIVGLDRHTAVIAPSVGIANVVDDGVELLIGILLGRVRHPGQLANVLTHRILDRLHHLQSSLFAFGAERAIDIELAQSHAQVLHSKTGRDCARRARRIAPTAPCPEEWDCSSSRFHRRIDRSPHSQMSTMNMAERLTRLSLGQTLRGTRLEGISLRRTTQWHLGAIPHDCEGD